MPCLWGQHNNSQVFLTVGIIDSASVNVTGTGRFGASAPPPNLFQALIDTGAQATMISTKVVTTLSLTPIGKRPIQGVGPNVTYHNEYLFRVAFLFPVLSPHQIGVLGARARLIPLSQVGQYLGLEGRSRNGAELDFFGKC